MTAKVIQRRPARFGWEFARATFQASIAYVVSRFSRAIANNDSEPNVRYHSGHGSVVTWPHPMKREELASRIQNWAEQLFALGVILFIVGVPWAWYTRSSIATLVVVIGSAACSIALHVAKWFFDDVTN